MKFTHKISGRLPLLLIHRQILLKRLNPKVIIIPHARKCFPPQIDLEPARTREILQRVVAGRDIQTHAGHGPHGVGELGVLAGTVGTGEEDDG